MPLRGTDSSRIFVLRFRGFEGRERLWPVARRARAGRDNGSVAGLSRWLGMRYGSVELKASQASAAVSQASPRRYHSIAEFMSGAMVAAS